MSEQLRLSRVEPVRVWSGWLGSFRDESGHVLCGESNLLRRISFRQNGYWKLQKSENYFAGYKRAVKRRQQRIAGSVRSVGFDGDRQIRSAQLLGSACSNEYRYLVVVA